VCLLLNGRAYKSQQEQYMYVGDTVGCLLLRTGLEIDTANQNFLLWIGQAQVGLNEPSHISQDTNVIAEIATIECSTQNELIGGSSDRTVSAHCLTVLQRVHMR
jgi:hypothetical protein